jgi:hypothetical protein
MNKGMSVTLGLTVVTFFAVALVMNLGLERVAELDERISLNTVPLVTERVEVAVYTLESAPDGSTVELNLRDKYNVTDENGGGIAYEFDSYLPSEDETKMREIDPPGNSIVNVGKEEEGKSEYICIEKKGSVTVSAGEC